MKPMDTDRVFHYLQNYSCPRVDRIEVLDCSEGRADGRGERAAIAFLEIMQVVRN